MFTEYRGGVRVGYLQADPVDGSSFERTTVAQLERPRLFLILPIYFHQFGEPGLFFAPKLTDLYHETRMLT